MISTNFTTEQQRELIDGILRLKPETYLYSGLAGNVEVVRSAYNGPYDGTAQSFRNIYQTAVDAIRRRALTPNQKYIEAFQEGFSGDAAQKSGIGANENMVINQLIARGLDCTVENIRALIGELWDSLEDNPQYTQDKAASDLRARRIAEMVGDPPQHGFSLQIGLKKFAFDKHGKTFDYQRGMSQGGSLSAKGAWSPGQGGFDSLSDAEVENLWTLWRTTNDLRGKTVQELRAIVKSGGKTDIFHKDVHPDVAPEQDDRLHHPVTNEPFGQRSLIKYINEAPYNGRNLISRNGRVVPRLRQLFEQTIRGELG